MNYLEIIENIRNANNPFDILSNVDNLNWLFEKEKYRIRANKRSKQKEISEIDKILKYMELIKCIKS